jgi:hypothetical protein
MDPSTLRFEEGTIHGGVLLILVVNLSLAPYPLVYYFLQLIEGSAGGGVDGVVRSVIFSQHPALKCHHCRPQRIPVGDLSHVSS